MTVVAATNSRRESVPAERESMLPTRGRTWLLHVATCLVATLAFTYPIWLAPDTLLNDLGDARLNAWTMAWDAHAIATDPSNLFNANIFWPRSNALALSENLLGLAPVAAPFALAGHPVLGYNVAMLASFFLFALATALWVRYLTGDNVAALVAGIAAAFAPSRLDHLPQLQIGRAHV